MNNDAKTAAGEGVAIIGLAVRFPGADSVEQFWANLRAGVESITFFTDQELREAGVDPAVIAAPGYVKANGVLQGADRFDAAFFGVSPREAEAMDPQHRVFLELAWEAMERAGYDPARTPGRVGVFAGAGLSTYLLRNLAPNRAFAESVGELPLLLGNNKDFVPTRVSYKLDLRGPSVNVNTACSTSLVAAHLACQSLLDFHCDLALAGGVSVQVPQLQGYLHTEGGIGSPDGHCRAFDAQARGTVSGNGAGIVVLKRLADALADGDTIHAVIRGSAVNNDGSDKIGFTAPSVTGQSRVIAEALEVAGVSPDEISYVEAHGTGTELGDPIEVAALTEVFGDGCGRARRCALGSVKTNIGHLDEAAGAAGLIKTVLALSHRELPPSLHYTTPNPKINFARSAFAVNAQLTPWTSSSGAPRVAGVSSFGLGGTNAHLVLEEAPQPSAGSLGRTHQLLVLSARTPTALSRQATNLATWLDTVGGEADLADVAFTLAQGRRAFAHRRSVVARNASEAAKALRTSALDSTAVPDGGREVVFLLSGQGSQYPGMLAGLYAAEPVFRYVIDRGAELLRRRLGFDLRELLGATTADSAVRLKQTAITQPALFLVDYALAELWRSWGIKPAALIGHSLGEYVAACVAGVFSFEDALSVVTERGALMQAQASGAMLAVGLGETEAAAVAATHSLVIAAINAADACVLSGPEAGIVAAAAQLTARGVAATRLETSHAFHSPSMEPVLAPLAAKVRSVRRNPPQIPIVSNVTGMWLTAAEAQDPEYWARQVRAPVRFADGVKLAQSARDRVLLEVGPGRALASMAQRIVGRERKQVVLTSARTAAQVNDDVAHLLTTLGQLWQSGVAVDWTGFHAGQSRHRVMLPTYPFERQRYWVEAPRSVVSNEAATANARTLREQRAGLELAEAKAAANPACTEAPTYPAFSQAMDRWCGELLFYYVAGGTGGPVRGRRKSRDELRAALRITPVFAKAFDAFLRVLSADGFLRAEGNEVVWLRDAGSVRPSAVGRDELLRQFPEFRGIVRLVEHCVTHYPAALSGDLPAITVLYPEGRSDLLEASARDSARTTNKEVYISVLRTALQQRAAAARRPFRVLEVGVGDGLLAGQVAPALRGLNVEYTATDLSQAFVRKAEKAAAAAGLEFLKFGVLDVSRDPLAQGFVAGGYDAVICLDVIHATPRLAETLGNLRTLLAPGGLLGVIEKVRLERWIDLVWGLAEGWWYFADAEVRRDGPLLPASAWDALLRRTQFTDVTVLPTGEAARMTTDYALLLGERLAGESAAAAPRRRPLDRADWFHVPAWTEATVRCMVGAALPEDLVLLGGAEPWATQLAQQLRDGGANVTCAANGVERTPEEWRALLLSPGRRGTHVVHLGGCTDEPGRRQLSELVQIASTLAGGSGPSVISIVATQAWATRPDEIVHPDKALVTGPLRVIPLEYPNVGCRAIDLRLGETGSIDWLAGELRSAVNDPVIAWRGGRRLVPSAVRRRLPDANASRSGLRERGVYLITGGFGSMGRAFARELAKSVRARLVLVGRKIDGVEQERLQAELTAAGAEVLALQADVADEGQMTQVVRRAKERFGALHGVLHTAGVYGQGLMAARTETEIDATLAPKVAGSCALARVIDGETLDFVIVCSSLASLLPVAGQVDYCAANAFLDAWAGEYARRTGTRTISIAWGMWQELGMMEHASIATAQQQAVRTEIEREGWTEAGVAALRRILAHGESGTIIVSPHPVRLSWRPAHPLLSARVERDGWVEYEAMLDPRRDWVANEHRLDGCAILPGTAYLELAHAAFADHTGADRVEMREVYFLSPLVFERDEPREVRVILRAETFHIVSRLGDDPWNEHVRGEIRLGQDAPAERGPAVSVEPVALPDDAVQFGERWRNLRSIAFGTDTGVAELELPAQFADEVASYRLHPALLDIATGFITLRHPLPDSLPFGYRRVTVHGALPARLRSEVRVTAKTETALEVDATLADAAGRVCVEIAGYQLRRMPRAATASEADNARLLIGAQGGADSVALVRTHRRAPGPNEVEIQVEAAGLNFIEVLYSLGLLPAAPELEQSFGLECSGRIVRVGSDVRGRTIGQTVMAYANGCFAGFVTVPAKATSPGPAGMSSVEAATLPAAFATAHHALITQGRLARGERVLIHAAAGGVGQAAVQIAQAVGAEVFATAGSPEKRAALQRMGIRHVMDSRTLAFADEVRRITGGRGVDVVLNSLGGEYMRASLELVAPHGRFLELGKRDLFAGGTLALKSFTRIISFIVIDVGPDLPGFDALWNDVTERIAAGIYRPLPHHTFPLVDARQAFELMARAGHIGKVVLTVDDPRELVKAAVITRPTVRGRTLAAIIGVTDGESPAPVVSTAPSAASGHARPELANEYVAPADATEQAIAAVWQELLGLAKVGARDNFFDLHGDSLLAAQVMARVHASLQVKLPLSALFDAPTVAGLAERVRAARPAHGVMPAAGQSGGRQVEGEL